MAFPGSGTQAKKKKKRSIIWFHRIMISIVERHQSFDRYQRYRGRKLSNNSEIGTGGPFSLSIRQQETDSTYFCYEYTEVPISSQCCVEVRTVISPGVRPILDFGPMFSDGQVLTTLGSGTKVMIRLRFFFDYYDCWCLFFFLPGVFLFGFLVD